MVRIAIWVEVASDSDTTYKDRHLGVSIDEPLAKNFDVAEPQKIWITASADETYYVADSTPHLTPIRLIEVFDLSPGDHYIEIGVNSPPPYYWYVVVAAGRKGLTSDWMRISSEDFLHISFNTDDVGETGYPKFSILRYNQRYCYSGETIVGINYSTPSIVDWNLSITPSCGDIKCGVNPNIGEQYKPNTLLIVTSPSFTDTEVGRGWIATEISDTFMYFDDWAVPTFIRDPTYGKVPVAWTGTITPMLTSIKQIQPTDYLKTLTGHVENDAPTPQEFYTQGRSLAKLSQWTPVKDDEFNIYFGPQPEGYQTTCLDADLPLPQDPNLGKVTLQNFQLRYEAGRTSLIDPSPGRRIYYVATLTYAGNPPGGWGVYPYIRIPEDPLAPLHSPIVAIGPQIFYNYKGITMSQPAATSVDFEHTIYLTQQMINQGYFTVEVGRLVSSGGTLPNLIPDEVHTIPIQTGVTSATLQSLTLSKFTPSYSAILNSLTLSKFTPQTAGVLKSLTISKIAPPPPEYATLSGKLLGLLGPVADAEISLNNTYKTKTARDGSFSITGITPAKYTINATPTKTLDKILYSTLKTLIDLSAPTVYTRTFTMPTNMLTLAAAGGVATIAMTAVALTPSKKPKPAIW